jgi:hypothetical protein
MSWASVVKRNTASVVKRNTEKHVEPTHTPDEKQIAPVHHDVKP